MTLALCIADLQDSWLAISGIKAAPDNPTEIEVAYPFAMTYERSGEMLLQSAGWSTPYTEVWSELHLSRTLLPQAIADALGYRDQFLEKIRDDPTLGGNCQTVDRVSWVFGNVTWAGIENIGYRFTMRIKYHLT